MGVVDDRVEKLYSGGYNCQLTCCFAIIGIYDQMPYDFGMRSSQCMVDGAHKDRLMVHARTG